MYRKYARIFLRLLQETAIGAVKRELHSGSQRGGKFLTRCIYRYLLGGEFRKPGRSLGDTSVATVDYNSSLQLVTYLAVGGSKMALTPVQIT